MSDLALKRKFLKLYGLEAQLSQSILEILGLHRVSKGEYLCRQGDDLSHLFVLVAGKLQIDTLHADGHHTVFAFETPLALVGDVELFTYQPVFCNAQALEDSFVLAAPVTTLWNYGYDDPTFLRFLLDHLRGKIADSNTLRAYAPLPLEQRLATYLLWRLEGNAHHFKLENREVLAALLDTSTRHLNRSLKQLEALGIIHRRNKTVTILNAQKLAKMTRDPVKKKT